jgi:glycosyltransferase involved in cell wall biosynthesis
VAPVRWLYLGRLMAHKGVLTVLEAVVRAGDRVTLTLAGSGPLEAEVDARIAALRLTGRVRRLAPVPTDEVAGLLHEHDLLVHASHRETFGMTVVEAVATGTPVLVARSAGPAETLDGVASLAGGMFAPTEDPEVLLVAFRKLQVRFGALDVLGARDVLLSRYGREAVAGQLLDAYAGGRMTTDGAVPLAESPALQRLAARLPSPVPEALVRTARRIGRRLGGFAAR